MEIHSHLEHHLRKVNALLPLPTYVKLYELVKKTKPNQIIEIGTAHGACTIVMALACKDNQISTKIRSIDVFEQRTHIPSSRKRFGSKAENVKIVETHFRNSCVENLIELFVGTSEEYFEQNSNPPCYDLVILDADGRIDRDLLFLLPALRNGTILMIDDLDGFPQVSRPLTKTMVDLKHVITKSIVDQMLSDNLLRKIDIFGNTGFFEVVNSHNWTEKNIKNLALKSYRELVFIHFNKQEIPKSIVVQILSGNAILRKLLNLLIQVNRLLKKR